MKFGMFIEQNLPRPWTPDDEHRLHELRLLRDAAATKRARGSSELLEQALELGDLLLAEPAADPAGVVQHAVLVVVADEERADAARATLLAWKPTTHDELLAEHVLDLRPRR
jgi:hypothetical protein